MNIFKKIFSQTKKPEGILGKMMVNSMNAGHTPMALWGMKHLPLLHPQNIVDLGCGGGQNVENLLNAYSSAYVTAIDYSAVSVEKSKQKNATAIQANRCQIIQDDVSKLSLKDNRYDLATAFETIYFWPGPLESFKEVFRILKSDSYFLIVNECDGTNPKDQKWLDMIDGMSIYPKDELVDYLKKAGFDSVQVVHDQEKHWICFLSHKK